MISREKSAEDRQKEREAKYDQEVAEARIERALVRYQRFLYAPHGSQERKPKER